MLNLMLLLQSQELSSLKNSVRAHILDLFLALHLKKQLKKNCFPFSPRHDFKGLIDLIAEHLWTQCQNVPESSLMAQWEKYQTYINCYGARTIDKFNALVENAKDNVYCACELGDIYYYGYTFYSSGKNNPVEIPQNFRMAFKYYSRCTHEPNLIQGACWSAGYILHKKLFGTSGPDLDRAEQLYKRCGEFPPALNSLGQIEKEKGDRIYLGKNYEQLTAAEKRAVKTHYTRFINYSYTACTREWLYAYNALYDFYYHEVYKPVRDDLSTGKGYRDIDPISMLRLAANESALRCCTSNNLATLSTLYRSMHVCFLA